VEEGVTLGSSGVSEDAAIPEGVFGFVAAKLQQSKQRVFVDCMA